MARIHVQVAATNALDRSKTMSFTALVDTGATTLVLPAAWRAQLGSFESSTTVDIEMADQRVVQAEISGPVSIQLEGFREIFSEAIFMTTEPMNGTYEPLVGCIVLEQSGAAVDMAGHRLVHAEHYYVK